MANGAKPAQLDRTQYLKELAAKVLAAKLGPAAGADAADLELFRKQIIARPDDLRRKLLGANVQRRRLLEATQRRALDLLDVTPDLLGPLGLLRYEGSHSRLVARFVDATTEPLLAAALLPAVLALVGADKHASPGDFRNAVVEHERWFVSGRVDISIALPKCLVLIEMKIDAEEGPDQLLRYRKELDAAKGTRAPVLVYLTLPGATKSSSGVDHVHITLDKLLLSWLPLAGTGGGSAEYLARYLKSIALLVGCAGVGRFDDWTITQQGAALKLVEAIA
jgi:hypothetical protein